MAMADFDHSDFDLAKQEELDKTLLVKFYVKSVQDKSKTAEEGRPIFKEIEYIDIKVPGQRDGAARPATFRDKQRFPRHYAAFKQRIEMPEEGTPLIEWPVMSRAMADELAFMNIKTVEQLASVSDTVAGKFMAAHTWKNKAKQWLDRAKSDVTVDQLTRELKARDEMLEKLQTQLDELNARISEE